jgi:hypothetical protein
MRSRRLIGHTLAGLGLVLAATSLSAAILQYALPIGIGWLVVLAVLLLLIGLIVLITELLERWLSRSQAALVDGLQAGWTTGHSD